MQITHTVTSDEEGRTAEGLLRSKLGLSTTMMRKLKKNSGVHLNNSPIYLKQRVQKGDLLSFNIELQSNTTIHPQPIPLNIIHEDQHLLILKKPPNMLVHPLKHEPYNTLANAVIYYYNQNNIEGTFHPISRLDRNTSGLVVIAKNPYASNLLCKQLHTADFQREYAAVVHGQIKQRQAIIALPIARCEDSAVKHRVHQSGRRAVTHYSVVSSLHNKALVQIRLETGRTHQIRVHMSHIGHPLVGDDLYGGRSEGINRQALHCCRVSLTHPVTGSKLQFNSPLPRDMQRLLKL